MGFEPTTFPVLPGRAQKFRNHAAILPGLDLMFASHSFGPAGILFRVNQRPWTSILQ